MVVERIGQSGVFSPCSNLREHSVCTNSVSLFDVLLSMRTSQFLLLSLARFIQHGQPILKKFVVP